MSKQLDESMNIALPAGYHCAVTWGIPTDFGGMTSAMLRRSRAFSTEGGQAVDILTFDYQNDYADIACELEVSGMMLPGMRLFNIWDELREFSDEQLGRAVGAQRLVGEFAPLSVDEPHQEDSFDGQIRRRIRNDSTGVITLQVDYLRSDGTIFVSDQRDLHERGANGGRRVTLCDRRGTPVAAWNQMWPLYLFWLDAHIAGRETFMVIDSKSTANFLTRYRRDNVVTMHMVHNSHMAAGEEPPFGELSSVRKFAFERLSSFDSVVLLTQAQMKDVNTAYSADEVTCVIPNSTDLEPMDPLRANGSRHGVMLASLTKRKRIAHALAAMKKVNSDSSDFTLIIYGHGPERDRLARTIQEDGLNKVVRLAGYTPDAKHYLKSASFTLLTSTMEGLPLVLLEAMSSGCIPIAYDIPYGPADLIHDGVNGFIVKSGDIETLAQRIIQVGEMPEEDLMTMRLRARASVEKFSDSAATAEWGAQMRAAVDRKLAKSIETFKSTAH